MTCNCIYSSKDNKCNLHDDIDENITDYLLVDNDGYCLINETDANFNTALCCNYEDEEWVKKL